MGDGADRIGLLAQLRSTCGGIFDRLERFTPEQRAGLFYLIECEWCWDCGRRQSVCDGHSTTEEG